MKGDGCFNAVKNSLEVREARIEDSMQPLLKAPCNKPENRMAVWVD